MLVSVLLVESKMATTFPSLLPRLSDDLWFSLEKRLDDDTALAKEEKEYAASLQKIVDKGSDIIPIGKRKEEQEQQTRDEEDEDEIEDDEDTGEDMEDDTDEYESASPDAESIEGAEVEMLDSSLI